MAEKCGNGKTLQDYHLVSIRVKKTCYGQMLYARYLAGHMAPKCSQTLALSVAIASEFKKTVQLYKLLLTFF